MKKENWKKNFIEDFEVSFTPEKELGEFRSNVGLTKAIDETKYMRFKKTNLILIATTSLLLVAGTSIGVTFAVANGNNDRWDDIIKPYETDMKKYCDSVDEDGLLIYRNKEYNLYIYEGKKDIDNQRFYQYFYIVDLYINNELNIIFSSQTLTDTSVKISKDGFGLINNDISIKGEQLKVELSYKGETKTLTVDL